jgi:2-polyprenyl-3-methyl-5-hydroxy-6-metoxy-1,4-benzoquinol methylase
MTDEQLDTIQTRYCNKTVAGCYDLRYTDLQGRVSSWMMRRALRRALAAVPAGGRVLDLPCGTGIYCWCISKLGFRVTAGDISGEMIDVARQREGHGASSPTFFQGDLFHLAFGDRAFDAIVCMRFMNLVDRSVRIAAVRAMVRLADTHIVSYYHKYTLKHFSRVLRYWLGLRRAPRPRLSRDELRAELEEAGMTISRWITVAPFLSEAWIIVMSRSEGAVQPAGGG